MIPSSRISYTQYNGLTTVMVEKTAGSNYPYRRFTRAAFIYYLGMDKLKP